VSDKSAESDRRYFELFAVVLRTTYSLSQTTDTWRENAAAIAKDLMPAAFLEVPRKGMDVGGPEASRYGIAFNGWDDDALQELLLATLALTIARASAPAEQSPTWIKGADGLERLALVAGAEVVRFGAVLDRLLESYRRRMAPRPRAQAAKP
jgi:hypothetical protein